MARTGVTLAFTAVGAAAGAYFGNPMLGAQLGMIAGSIAGALLFPGGEDQKGPRLGDLRVADASYGITIPLVYGAARVGGVMIWTSGIEERSSEESMKGGGPTATTYSYYASCAIGLCEGPIEAVRKIWFDTRLVYDVSANNLGIINQRMGDIDPRHLLTAEELEKRRNEIEAELSAVQSSLTVYLGSEDQLPDPTMEAHEGAGQVPAHRGLAYLLFADLPLQAYGNRIPSVSAEVMTAASPAYPKRTVSPDAVHTDQMVMDSARQLLWERHDQTLVQIDALNNTVRLSGSVITSKANGEELATPLGLGLAVDVDGAVYLPTKITSNTHRLIRVDPVSFAATHVNVSNLTYLPEPLAPCSCIHASPTFIWWSSFVFNYVAVFIRPGAMHPSTGDVVTLMQQFAIVRFGGELAGLRGQNLAIDRDETAWVVCSAGHAGNVLMLHFSPSGNYRHFDISEHLRGGDYITYDAQTHAVLVRGYPPGNTSQKRIVRFDCGTQEVTGISPPFSAHSYMDSAWRHGVQGRLLWWPSAPGFQVFDVDSLTIVETYDVTTWPGGTLGYGGLYDVGTAAMWQSESGAGLGKYYFGRQEPQPVTLGSIVDDLSQRAGLPASALNTAALTEPVHGFVMSQRSEARSSVEMLLSAFLADGVESDWALLFRHRALAPVATLTADDLAAHEPGATLPDVLTPARLDDQQLPIRVDITYADPARDYQDTVQHARRFQAGQRARSQREVRTPVLLTADQAKQLAEQSLTEAWVSRTTYRLTLPYRWSTLDPGDVLAVEALGQSQLMRVQQIQHGANGILDCTAVAYDAHTYTASMSVGVVADASTAQQIVFLAPTELVLIDTHLLRDVDEGPGYYLAMGGQGGGQWPGATAFSSIDGSAWRMEETITHAMSYGRSLTTLGEGTPYVFDTGHTVDVRLVSGSLSSASELDVINGANAGLLGEELLQWCTATPLDATTWRLSHLLRGRRGTEWAIPDHAEGERFVVLTPTTIRREDMSLSEVGTTRLYRAVTNNTDLLQTSTQPFKNTALGLKPYSPAHVHITTEAGLPVLAWERRTRLGGQWVNGRDVPLGEAEEKYEVDVVVDGVVVSTLSSEVPHVAYTPTPGGVWQIYQMGQLGRGWPATYP